jgi:hypothetical protein
VRKLASHGVVGLDGAVKKVPKGLLVGAGHPQIQGAGVEVGPQSSGARPLGTATDAIGVERVPVRVEPLDAIGFTAPLMIQEGLDYGHPVALAGLHLRLRPIDGIDLRL